MFFSTGKNNSNNTQAEPYMNAPKSRAVTGPIHTNEGQNPYQPPYPQQGPQGYGPYGPEHPQFPRFNPYNNHPNMGGGYPPPYPYPQPHLQQPGIQQPQDGLYAEQKSDKKIAQKENLKSLSFWQDDNDYYDQAAETPKGSPLKFVAAIMGLVVFTIIVWLGYRFATQPQNDQIPLIQAEAGPYKRRPENPGGANFPHQEMLVYGRLDPQMDNQTVEHVLPQDYAPDQQYPQQYQQNGQQPYEAYPPQQGEQQQQMMPQQPQQMHPQMQMPQQPVQQALPQVAQPQMQQQPVQAPQPQQTAQAAQQGVVSPDQVAQATSSIEKALETVEEMPAAAPPTKAKIAEDGDAKTLTPGYYMQLGKSLPSEKSAQSHWAWIKKKFPGELSDMKPIIRPTDAGVKKKFSVLVGPFSSRNAALKKCVKISNGCSVKHIS